MPLSTGPLTALAVGAAIVALGYLIRFREWTFLVAGHDDTADVPDDVAATVVGNLTLRVGVATLAFGALLAVTSVPTAVSAAFFALICLAAARAVYRLQTYRPAHA